NWQWKPAVAYCRYADDFVLIVKGTKAQAEAIREECRGVLEGSLKLCVFRSIRSRIGIEVRSAIRIHSINR
ncbi:hypothetical protein, partial [Escherichia coli]